jgi:hypothetical protein
MQIARLVWQIIKANEALSTQGDRSFVSGPAATSMGSTKRGPLAASCIPNAAIRAENTTCQARYSQTRTQAFFIHRGARNAARRAGVGRVSPGPPPAEELYLTLLIVIVMALKHALQPEARKRPLLQEKTAAGKRKNDELPLGKATPRLGNAEMKQTAPNPAKVRVPAGSVVEPWSQSNWFVNDTENRDNRHSKGAGPTGSPRQGPCPCRLCVWGHQWRHATHLCPARHALPVFHSPQQLVSLLRVLVSLLGCTHGCRAADWRVYFPRLPGCLCRCICLHRQWPSPLQ